MKKILASPFLYYLRLLSKIQLIKIKPKIVGIGGSSGKTSTAHLVEIILASHFNVRPSRGKNSETGIPLTILGLEVNTYRFNDWFVLGIKALLKIFLDFKKFDVLVAEMGIDGPTEPKNMSYLLKIIKPDISILTNVSLEHSVYFDNLVTEVDPNKREEKIIEMLTDDETKILTEINEKSQAVINLDDENIRKILPKIKANKVTLSSDKKDADFFIKKHSVDLKGTDLVFVHSQKEYVLHVSTPLPYFYSYSILFAIIAAQILSISVEDSIKFLETNFSLPGGRLSVFEGIKNTKIIDSTYNNSIEAISGILDFVNLISDGRRKVGIIGDIREQGKQSEDLHLKLAKKISGTLDFAILIGELNMRFTSKELEKLNFDFKSFETFSGAKSTILDSIKENDLILVKGSQNKILLERAVELLLKDKSDVDKLTRRGKFWDKVRDVTA